MGGQLSKALGASHASWVEGDIGADCVGKLFGNKEMRILMLGLDAAGKTSKFKTRFGCGFRINTGRTSCKWKRW